MHTLLGGQEYQNNLMMKRFMFEAFDSYVSLFYLAFVQVKFLFF